MRHVDYKVTTWYKASFDDKVDMQEVIEVIKKEGIGNIMDMEGLHDNEEIYEVEEFMSVEENEGFSTVEVYDNDKLIWDNGKR